MRKIFKKSIEELEVALAGVKKRRDAMREMMAQVKEYPPRFVTECADLSQEEGELEKLLEIRRSEVSPSDRF